MWTTIFSSLPSEEMLRDYFTTGRAIFKEAGFNLRSWASNSQVLTDLAKHENIQDSDPVTKVLGLRWETGTDVISFPKKGNVPSESALMIKRKVLKQSSSTYDPLGILSPITVRSKILIQSLWQRKFEWDEPLPEDVTTVWTNVSHDLAKAAETEIPRCYFTQETDIRNIAQPFTQETDSSNESVPPTGDVTILHVFTDGSDEKMIIVGACAYIVSGNEDLFTGDGKKCRTMFRMRKLTARTTNSYMYSTTSESLRSMRVPGKKSSLVMA